MKIRKKNRMEGFDYSSDNLYFVTSCVKNNVCCFGRVIPVGTGRDLSVQNPQNQNPQNQNPQNQNPQNQNLDYQIFDYNHSNNLLFQKNSEIKYVVELNQYGLIVDKKIKWLMDQYPYVDIHNYIVMPNHFHLILEIDRNKTAQNSTKIKSLSSLIGALKSTSSTEIHNAGLIKFAWHRSFHDHIIRDENAYNKIFDYISNNPKNWFKDKFYAI
ncbi:transposase [Flavobacterium sp.]|uniref:transposase n=2 Tax=Flavobacterium TaxID=237 RepID=UPI0039E69EAD